MLSSSFEVSKNETIWRVQLYSDTWAELEDCSKNEKSMSGTNGCRKQTSEKLRK